ncbi:MAG: D-alanine--D-alanine ligase family protein [Patescibacteria group bacterium]
MKQIGILLGGVSSEHRVSLKSGQAVLDNINRRKYKPCKLKIREDGRWCFSIKELKGMDCVFIALHGKGGEDGTIQGFLETLGVNYTGPGVFSSALGMDKYSCKELWKGHDLPTIPHQIVETPQECLSNHFPFVLKPRKEGSSLGISIVRKEAEVGECFENARHYDEDVLLEPYIKGRELTVGVLNISGQLKALPIVEIIPATEFYNYEAKYNRSDTEYIVPANLSAKVTRKIQEIAVRACKIIKINSFSRVDFLLETTHPYLLEVNTIPGLTSHSLLPKAAQANGISFTELISRMIEGGFNNRTTRLPTRFDARRAGQV